MNARAFSFFCLLSLPITSFAASTGDTSLSAIATILSSTVLSTLISAIVAFAVARMSLFTDTVTKVRSEYKKEFRHMAVCFLTCASSNSPCKTSAENRR